jgi:senataxin
MHPLISAWPNKQFYGSNLQDGDNVTSEEYTKHWHSEGLLPPLSVFDVHGKEEMSESGSWLNEMEASVAMQVLRLFYTYLVKTSPVVTPESVPVTIGIITPYTAQLEFVTELVAAESKKWSANRLAVVCKTVDGFQGQECDVVLFLAVRSNDKKRFGFHKDQRRLNVAITRPRFSLLIICNVDTLGAEPNWKDLLTSTQKFTAKTHVGLGKMVAAFAQKKSRVATLRDTPKAAFFEHSLWGTNVCFTSEFEHSFRKLSEGDKDRGFDHVMRLANGNWPQRSDSLVGSVDGILMGIVSTISLAGIVLVWGIDLQVISF